MQNACREIIKESLANRENFSKNDFEVLKIRVSKKHGLGTIVKNTQILEVAKDSEVSELRKLFSRKPTRSISGVSVIAVMTAPELKCPHGVCTFCPKGEGASQSYTGKEPSSRRSRMNDYDPYRTVENRLWQLKRIGHPVDKVELIVQGATFTSAPPEYQETFIKSCTEAMLAQSEGVWKRPSSTMEGVHLALPRFVGHRLSTWGEVSKEAETSKVRPVGITIETKPEYCQPQHLNKLLELGATRVEIGVQTVYDDILKATNRGHTVQDSIGATQRLKDCGIKVNYHMMPGLPGSSFEKDLHSLKEVFDNPDFRPDMLKIYPTLVIEGTTLYQQWKRGEFTPLSNEEAAEIIVKAKKHFPPWVRIMRINRDIPSTEISAGILRTDLRELVKERQKELGVECHCIRCREVGHRAQKDGIYPQNVEVRELEYEASSGKEIFISAEDFENGILIGYLRLRFPSDSIFRPEITPETALVRELHVYGPEVPIGETANERAFQHRGYGKKLLARAEGLSREKGFKKLLVLSGIGAKQYYKKLGYDYDGVYMRKLL